MNTTTNKQKMIVLQLILIMVGVLMILYTKSGITEYLPPCNFRVCFGVICPTCGVTRCVSNILSLDLKTAFIYHPTMFVLIIYLGLLDLIYIINTMLNKNYLRKLYPTLPMVFVYFSVFLIQYIYRVYMTSNGLGYEFL